MTVITTDILVTGIRRDDVFTWLSDFSRHQKFLIAGFPNLKTENTNKIVLPFQTGFKQRELGYTFIDADDSHGGRRIRISTTGKRTKGHLNYSLRTMKPSTNTLITLHMDYEPGTVLGMVLVSSIQQSLEKCFALVLNEMASHIKEDFNL
jgi:hypothetical protein